MTSDLGNGADPDGPEVPEPLGLLVSYGFAERDDEARFHTTDLGRDVWGALELARRMESRAAPVKVALAYIDRQFEAHYGRPDPDLDLDNEPMWAIFLSELRYLLEAGDYSP
jgi:hypothetical protein